MVEELQPYRVEVRYVPVSRSNRVVPMESTYIKDPKVETLAVVSVRDTGYMRNVEYIER